MQQQQQQLKACEAFLNFAGTLQTHATQKQYLWLIQRYAAYRKTFDLDQIEEEDNKNHKLAVARIREFLLSLQAAKLSRGSLNNYKAALKHFYEMNDISLNWRKINRFAGMEDAKCGVKDKDRAYTHEEIQKMLGRANQKVRAIILLLASAGVRVGAIQSIYLKHIKKVQKDGIKTYQILVYAGHKDEYITFCTPETAQAIDSYLSDRRNAGEKLDDISPLFRTDFYANDLFKVRNNIRPMKTEAVSKAIQTTLRKSGLLSAHQIITESQGLTRTRYEVQRNHGFRKFANTQMVLAEVNGAAKEMLLGHSIGLDDKYYRPTPQQLFDEYSKAIDLLTINDENRLRKRVEELTIRTSDISVLKQQIDELRDVMMKQRQPHRGG